MKQGSSQDVRTQEEVERLGAVTRDDHAMTTLLV